MIPISKYIQNDMQKRAAQRVARFLCLWGYWFLCPFYLLFAIYLHKTNLATAVRKSGEELIVKSKMYDFISVTRTT